MDFLCGFKSQSIIVIPRLLTHAWERITTEVMPKRKIVPTQYLSFDVIF